MVKHVGIHQKGGLSLSDMVKSIRNHPDFPDAGAIGVFVGVVRGQSSGAAVQKLHLEAYEERADEVLNQICNELRTKKGIVDVKISHFVGEFDVSDDLVYVVVAGAHRDDVFPVLKVAVDRYKKEAPIWKKEHLTDGESRWV
ncbi:MAG: molybdenum cofactor biosynthesis protein MoaE, partial [Candidatus Bathyarchaeota archaeon]